MEIVDTQVHLNRLIPGWQTADPDLVLQAAVAAMDAVGVDAVLIAEGWAEEAPKHGQTLPNGVFRLDPTFSRHAVEKFPNRFGYLVSFDHSDPELERLISEVRQEPGCLSLRVVPRATDLDLFRDGGFGSLFAAAQQYEVPIFLGIQRNVPLLEPYLQKFPKVWMILDHIGIGITALRASQQPPQAQAWMTPTLEGRLEELEFILGLAKYQNLAIKWSNAQSRLTDQPYPHEDAVGHLRRVIDAFGVERLMWASDYTESRTLHTWAQSLHYLLYSDLLSETEKEWILGKSARQILNWPR